MDTPRANIKVWLGAYEKGFGCTMRYGGSIEQ